MPSAQDVIIQSLLPSHVSGDVCARKEDLPVSKSIKYSGPHTTSAHPATYHFCMRVIVLSSHSGISGVPLESSGLRFSSTRSMNIRLNP